MQRFREQACDRGCREDAENCSESRVESAQEMLGGVFPIILVVDSDCGVLRLRGADVP